MSNCKSISSHQNHCLVFLSFSWWDIFSQFVRRRLEPPIRATRRNERLIASIKECTGRKQECHRKLRTRISQRFRDDQNSRPERFPPAWKRSYHRTLFRYRTTERCKDWSGEYIRYHSDRWNRPDRTAPFPGIWESALVRIWHQPSSPVPYVVSSQMQEMAISFFVTFSARTRLIWKGFGRESLPFTLDSGVGKP